MFLFCFPRRTNQEVGKQVRFLHIIKTQSINAIHLKRK
nr:MAG TPA: hypothetical protein [Caudoviricetes sp.]